MTKMANIDTLILTKVAEKPYHLEPHIPIDRRVIEKAIAKRHIDQPTAVSDHFTLSAHSMDNIELVPLKLITSNRDGIRISSKGKTIEPLFTLRIKQA